MTRNESSNQETPRAASGLQPTDGLQIRQGSDGGAEPTSRQRASGYRGDCLAGIRRDIRFPAKALRLRPIIVKRRFRLIRSALAHGVDYPAREGLLRPDYMNERIRRNDPAAHSIN